MALVDESREKIIAEMSQDQRDMFLIGMSYHSAFFTYLDQLSGRPVSMVNQYELDKVRDAMGRQGLNTELNTSNK